MYLFIAIQACIHFAYFINAGSITKEFEVFILGLLIFFLSSSCIILYNKYEKDEQ